MPNAYFCVDDLCFPLGFGGEERASHRRETFCVEAVFVSVSISGTEGKKYILNVIYSYLVLLIKPQLIAQQNHWK